VAEEPAGKRRRRRFSEGLERESGAEDKSVERRFSEGLERDASREDGPGAA
jgi:hypothetical protein